MFSLRCLSVQGVPCDHFQWCIGPQCPGSPPWHGTSLDRDPSPLALVLPPPGLGTLLDRDALPASDIWLPSLKTCSNLFTSWPSHPVADIWWLLKHLCTAQVGGTCRNRMLSCCWVNLQPCQKRIYQKGKFQKKPKKWSWYPIKNHPAQQCVSHTSENSWNCFGLEEGTYKECADWAQGSDGIEGLHGSVSR